VQDAAANRAQHNARIIFPRKCFDSRQRTRTRRGAVRAATASWAAALHAPINYTQKATFCQRAFSLLYTWLIEWNARGICRPQGVAKESPSALSDS
jgi:hypothetical protein